MKDLRNKLVLLLAFLNISILIYLIIIVNTLPKIKTQDFYPTNDVTILDSNNNLINHLPTFKSDITYEEIPQNVINALISTEDEAFFIHNGINPKRIIKAILTDIKSHYAKEGASTITQQVIKNTYLSSEKNINRKVKEIILAIKLENSMRKSDIITYYLNNVLFSDNIYGIYNASLYFFNKKPALLTVDEAAMLVGLIQLPNKYNPYKNLAEATIRRDIVLKAMYKNNFLTHDELEIYRNIKLENKLKKNVMFQNTSYYNPYLDLIDTKTKSLKTYMNKDIQYTLYEIATNKLGFLPDDKINIGLIAIDNHTAGILGIFGNRTANKKTINNVLVKRHMASTMKPLIDYLPYFEKTTASPGEVVIDEEYNYSDGTSLKNWDSIYKGAISLRQALKESRNIPALKIFKKTSKEVKIETLSRLGLTVPNNLYEADAIGCGNGLYSLFEVSNAYLAFANNGKFKKASCILNDDPFLQVIKPSSAFFINSILHDVFSKSKFVPKNTYMMAKTGQTNYDKKTALKYNIPSNATKESFVISYTKDITFGCYVGYDKIDSTSYLDRIKTQIPRTIMAYFMNKFQTNVGSPDTPSNIEKQKCIIKDNVLYLDESGVYEYFIKDALPPKYKEHNYIKI